MIRGLKAMRMLPLIATFFAVRSEAIGPISTDIALQSNVRSLGYSVSTSHLAAPTFAVIEVGFGHDQNCDF